MRILNSREIKIVSGAGSHDDKKSSDDSNAGNPRYNEPGVASCNNGIIGGIIAGLLGGIPGISLGLAGGAVAGNCFERNASENSNPPSLNDGDNRKTGNVSEK